MASASATLDNVMKAANEIENLFASLREHDKVSERLAYTGREPLPSERKILGLDEPPPSYFIGWGESDAFGYTNRKK